MEGRDKMKWSHVVEGQAIHLLGVSETCTCKARHVCQSCQGQDERLRAVNAKLLEALEGCESALRKDGERTLVVRNAGVIPSDGTMPHHLVLANQARAVIEEAKK
jgi:hypothetical protein